MNALNGIGLVVVAAVVAGVVVLTGPGHVYSKSIDLEYTLDPATLEYEFGEGANDAFAQAMHTFFGEHDSPNLPEDAEWEGLGIASAKQLAVGREQFRTNCLHCHGTSGDATGTTADFINPKPRNFRSGVIKFTSTPSGVPPTRADIMRVLLNGVAYTAMPSFSAYDNLDLKAITSYVQFLMMRGQTEILAAYDLDDDGTFDEEYSDEELQEAILEFMTDEFEVVSESWMAAKDEVVYPPIPRPEMSAESLARGKEIFLSAKTECSACHGEFGDGMGPNVYDAESKTFKLADNWGNAAQPADLRKGFYRGGNRPIDLYRRIYGGIKGTPMPSFADSLSPEEIWDVVNYTLSLPYLEEAN